MASLNWTMLTESGLPIPLPGEKFMLSTSSVSLSLFPSPPGATMSAKPPTDGTEHTSNKGSSYVSNKRVVYVKEGITGAQGGQLESSGVASSDSRQQLRTLSVPLSHFLDGRFAQPWFGATYYEALCIPSEGGGLDSPHILRLTFRESGGGQFYETVSEMKDRLGQTQHSGRATPIEALPLYEPGTAGSVGTSPLASSTSTTTTSGINPTSLATSMSVSEPTADDLLAASIARTADEQDQQAAQSRANVAAPPAEDEQCAARDGPPGYAP